MLSALRSSRTPQFKTSIILAQPLYQIHKFYSVTIKFLNSQFHFGNVTQLVFEGLSLIWFSCLSKVFSGVNWISPSTQLHPKQWARFLITGNRKVSFHFVDLSGLIAIHSYVIIITLIMMDDQHFNKHFEPVFLELKIFPHHQSSNLCIINQRHLAGQGMTS